MIKQCNDCGLFKSVSDFHISRNGKTLDGLKGACKDCSKAKRRVWAAKNRKREAEWNATKYEANPNYFVEKARKRDGHLLGNQFIEHVDRQVVYTMHEGMCGICEEFVAEDEFEVDHIIPLSKGGMHGYINVQPAHLFCNRSKSDKVIA